MTLDPSHGQFIPGIDFIIPRVHPASAEEIRYLYRWIFTGEELTLDQNPTDLLAQVTFRLDRKQHRRKTFRSLKRQCGWLGVQRLLITGPHPAIYVLSSAFTEFGGWVDFRVMESLFDFVVSVEPIESVPVDVARRMDVEFDRHKQMSVAHWLDLRKQDFKRQKEEIGRGYSELIARLEERLSQITMDLRRLHRSEYPTSPNQSDSPPTQQVILKSEQIHALEEERTRIRQELVDSETRASSLKRERLSKSSDEGEFSDQTLFTIQWNVIEAGEVV
jgi:hypothetical protein